MTLTRKAQGSQSPFGSRTQRMARAIVAAQHIASISTSKFMSSTSDAKVRRDSTTHFSGGIEATSPLNKYRRLPSIAI